MGNTKHGGYCDEHQAWHTCHRCQSCDRAVVTDPPYQLYWGGKWCTDCYDRIKAAS